MAEDETVCRLCGSVVDTTLAGGRRACCLNATPIAGICPEHGPLGPHHVREGERKGGRGGPGEARGNCGPGDGP